MLISLTIPSIYPLHPTRPSHLTYFQFFPLPFPFPFALPFPFLSFAPPSPSPSPASLVYRNPAPKSKPHSHSQSPLPASGPCNTSYIVHSITSCRRIRNPQSAPRIPPNRPLFDTTISTTIDHHTGTLQANTSPIPTYTNPTGPVVTCLLIILPPTACASLSTRDPVPCAAASPRPRRHQFTSLGPCAIRYSTFPTP